MSDPAPPAPPGAPEIAVIVTAHGRREFLREAVASILAQGILPPRLEVLVVKDFSDPDLDADFERAGVRHLETDEAPLGSKIALGIEATHAPLIAFLEDDDAYEPGRLARLLELFGQDRRLGYYRNGQLRVGRDGRPLVEEDAGRADAFLKEYGVVAAGPEELDRILPRLVRIDPDFNLSSIAVRRETVAARVPELRGLPAAVDSFVFYAALAARTGVWIESRPLTRYRVHGTNVSLWQGDSPEARASRAAYQGRFLESFRRIYDSVQRSGPTAAGRLAATAYYGSWILFRVLTGDGGRSALARDLRRYWSRSPWSAIRYRYDLSVWGLAAVLAPSAARSAFVRRRTRSAGAVAADPA